MKEKDRIAIEVYKRFFEAIEYIKSAGYIRGLGTFCNKYDFNRGRYTGVRQSLYRTDLPEYITYKHIDVSAIVFISRDYGISSDWILFGKGKMLK